jgi:hypothetical protein
MINHNNIKVTNIKSLLKIVFTAVLLSALTFSTTNCFAFTLFSSNSAVGNLTDKDAEQIASSSDNLDANVVKLALKAYNAAQQKGVNVRKPILTIIDYALASNEKRLWVVDLNRKRVIYNTWVAHGKYSGDYYHSDTFSNADGSLASSIGVYLTEDTYSGHNGYTLKIKGLEQGFNDRAEERRIVMHGAWYVGDNIIREHGTIGKSWGCPAIDPKLAVPVINTIKDGSIVFAYYPNKTWLNHSKYLNYSA